MLLFATLNHGDEFACVGPKKCINYDLKLWSPVIRCSSFSHYLLRNRLGCQTSTQVNFVAAATFCGSFFFVRVWPLCWPGWQLFVWKSDRKCSCFCSFWGRQTLGQILAGISENISHWQGPQKSANGRNPLSQPAIGGAKCVITSNMLIDC